MNYAEHRTIDALVTQYVMEYPCYTPTEVHNKEARGQPLATSHLQSAPEYSVDVSLALSICNKLLESGIHTRIDRFEDGWLVQLSINDGVFAVWQSPRLPVAICIAALLGTGIDPFTDEQIKKS